MLATQHRLVAIVATCAMTSQFADGAIQEPPGIEQPPASPSANEPGYGTGAAGSNPTNGVYLFSGEFYLPFVPDPCVLGESRLYGLPFGRVRALGDAPLGANTPVLPDLRVRGRGLDFNWARKYRSRIGPNTAMGNNWDFSYNLYVEPSGSDLLLHDGNTREDLYLFQPDGTWAADGFFRELRQEPDTSYTLTFSDTGTWSFFPLDGSPWQGRIREISDRNGNTLVLDYDGLGRLITIHDTLDTAGHTRDITVSYNVDGLIESVTDFTGRTVLYAYYDGIEPGGNFGDLKSVTTPAVVGTSTGNDFPAGKTTTYTYSTGFADGRLNHNLLTITDPKGQVYLTNEYAVTEDPFDVNFDRIVRQVWGDPVDIIDVVYAQTIPDPGNNFAVVKATVNDRDGNVSEHFYDGLNRLVLERDYTGRAGPSLPTDLDLAINPPINPLRPGDPPQFETRYEWNVDSLATLITHPNGNTTSNVYESDLDPLAPRRSRGNLREVHHLPGPLGGDQIEIVELFEYDTGQGGCCGTNFVVRWTDGRGNITSNGYDASGNLIRTRHRIPSIVEDFEYNAFGQMTRKVHPDNGSGSRRVDAFTYYDPFGGCMNGYPRDRIIDEPGFGLTTTYEYDCLGRLTRTIDPRGHDSLYEYNALDQVVRETGREVTDGGGVRYRKDTYFDANDNVVRIDVENIDDLGVLQPNTHFTTVYEYDILNYLTRSCQESGEHSGAIPGPPERPSCAGLPQSEFITVEYEYDANRNQALTRSGEAVEGGQPDNVIRMLYDERDLVYRTIRAEGSPDQSTTQSDYDGNANLTRTSQGLEGVARVTVNAYDGYDRLTRSTDPMGNVAVYVYDANSNLQSVRGDGELNDAPGGAGNLRLFEARYEYDPMNRLTRTVVEFFDTQTQTPIGDGQAITETFYSDNAQVIRVLDDNAHQTLTVYDTANRTSTTTDAKGNTRTYTYDPNSNIISVVELEKSDLLNPDEAFTTTYAYDNLDRLTRTTDNVGNTTNSAYDSRNNRVTDDDALGNVTRYEYDGINRLTRTTRFLTDDGTGAGNPAGLIVTAQAWDDNSRLIGRTDDNGHTTTYVYDSLNRLTRTAHADGTDRLDTYDVHDNLLSTTDPNGSVVTRTYDLLDRLTGSAVAPGPGVSTDTTFEVYQYDGLSRWVSAQDDDSLVTRSYDSMSNVADETLTVGSGPGQTSGTTTATYDGVNNKLTCTYPGGRVVTCTYDELDRKKTVSDVGGMIATYDFIGPLRIERREYGNGTRTEDQYDGILPNPPNDFGVKRIVRTTHTVVAGGGVIDDRTYTWDPLGNKSSRADQLPGGLTHAYVYDSIYRLTRSVETPPAGAALVVDYTFDGAGNRADLTGPGGGVYHLDPLAPPSDFPVNQYSATPRDRREYDENGNQTRMASCGDFNADGGVDLADYAELSACLTGPGVSASVTCRRFDCDHDADVDLFDFGSFQRVINAGAPQSAALLAYDYRNRMAEYTEGATGRRHTYAYDALGRRIVRITDADGAATESRYFYDGWQVAEEQDGIGATQATYVYGLYIDEALTMRRGGSNYYYHTDDLYNVMAMTDATGTVVERYDYEDYSRPIIGAHVQSPDADTAYVSDADNGQIIADEVSFDRPTRVRGVRWWGGYGFGPTTPTDSFAIRIHDDSGGWPGAVLFEAVPGDDVARAATGRTLNVGPGEFVYQADFPTAFDAAPGVTYWLVIINDTAGQPAAWGVESAANGNANLMFSTNGGGLWEVFPADTAFELRTDESPISNPYLFTGRRYDPESGWYYYRTRYLEPVAGRFTTRDTIGIWGDPINMGNGYTYVGNNTFSSGRIDPSGMAMALPIDVPSPPPPVIEITPEMEWEEFDRAWEMYVKARERWKFELDLWHRRGATPGSSSHMLDYPEEPQPPDWRPSSPRPSPPIFPAVERSSLDPFGRQTIMGITFTTPMQSMGWWAGGSIIYVTWWGPGPGRPGMTGFQWGVVPPAMIPTILSPPGFPTGFLPIPQWPGGGTPPVGPKQTAGLCIDESCELITRQGPRRLADIRVGDEVLASSGDFRRVVDKDFGRVWEHRRHDYVRISTTAGSIVLTRDHVIGGKPAGQWRNGDGMTMRCGAVATVTVRPATSEISGDLRLEGDADYVVEGGFVVGSMMSRYGAHP